MGYQELYDYGIDKAISEATQKCIEDIDIAEFNLALYHGTDRFALELADDTRNRYICAIKDYASAIKGYTIDWSLDHDEHEGEALIQLGRIQTESENFKYGSLYTTTSPFRMGLYAKKGRYLGELGYMVHFFRKFAKRNDLHFDLDDETDQILTGLSMEVDARESSPVYLKYYGMDKVASWEDGSEFSPLALKFFISSGNNDLQYSFRMNSEVSLRDFEEVAPDEECALFNANLDRIRKMIRERKCHYLKDSFEITDADIGRLALVGKIR